MNQPPIRPLKMAPLHIEGAMVQRCTDRSISVLPFGESDLIHLGCTPLEARLAAPGQLVAFRAARAWHSGPHHFAVGQLTGLWIDVDALELSPLTLHDHGLVDLDGMFPAEMFGPDFRQAQEGLSIYEFEEAASGDPAVSPGPQNTRESLMAHLGKDIRCLAAHVELGNLNFDDHPDQAIVHYGIAFEIGLLSMGETFSGLLPWSLLDNRPFLRALHGYALCRWREGDFAEAADSFEYMLYLNPIDNQGARYCLEDVQNGKPWRADL